MGQKPEGAHCRWRMSILYKRDRSERISQGAPGILPGLVWLWFEVGDELVLAEYLAVVTEH